MLDISKLRNNFEEISKRIRTRNRPYEQLDEFKLIDTKWRKATTQLQKLNADRNALSNQIGELIKNNKITEVNKIKTKVQKLKIRIEKLSIQQAKLDKQLKEIVFSIPNIPDKSVPLGKDENDNVEIRKWGEPTKFDFKPLTHWELAEKLDLADFERASKLSGSRHTVFKKDGAKLLRAIRDFTLDMHVKKASYIELQPPVLINPDILYGTGHLPKSKEDMFETMNGQFLSPTEEVPLTGYYRNEIIDEKQLPIHLTASTVSFRSEAGSAGKDVRGVIRQHQFYNTEMVCICKPEQSMDELEKMTSECEAVLKALEIPYRVITLCTGDMGSAAIKTYDVEVWFPCNEKYREISSCSNCDDYQARGSMIKYRDSKTKKTEFVHTLNGTGTSLNRLWVAIIENYQLHDGSIRIPDKLRKYFDNQEFIK